VDAGGAEDPAHLGIADAEERLEVEIRDEAASEESDSQGTVFFDSAHHSLLPTA
jgi:hypothetical protein